jgi:acyl-CoA thioesterase-2
MNEPGKGKSEYECRAAARTGDDSSTTAVVNETPLVDRLAVTAVEGDGAFVGHPPVGFDQRLFGGHILGQATLCAARTVAGNRVANSLHIYFLRSGGPHEKISYNVGTVRDGRSFSVRSVTVEQAGRTLALAHLTFTEPRTADPVEPIQMPDVPAPEHLPVLYERRLRGLPADGFNWPPGPDWRTASRPLDVRYVDTAESEPRCFWFRAAPVEVEDENLWRAVLAYASDRSMLPVVSRARGELVGHGHRRVASVDHALWFHATPRPGDWLLHVQDSPTSTSGLGVARGLVYARDGSVVASVMQQGVFSQG